jgi:hypothetical protein
MIPPPSWQEVQITTTYSTIAVGLPVSGARAFARVAGGGSASMESVAGNAPACTAIVVAKMDRDIDNADLPKWQFPCVVPGFETAMRCRDL